MNLSDKFQVTESENFVKIHDATLKNFTFRKITDLTELESEVLADSHCMGFESDGSMKFYIDEKQIVPSFGSNLFIHKARYVEYQQKNSQTVIPKKIHFIFFSKGKPFCLLYWLAIKAAIYHHPNYEIYLHTDAEPDFVYNVFFRNLKSKIIINIITEPTFLNGHIVRHFQHKSDYVRLNVLEEYGGIYLDLDLIVLRPFDNFLNQRFVMGLERPDCDDYLCNAVVMTEPHSELIQEWIHIYQKSWGEPFIAGWMGHSVIMPSLLRKKYGYMMTICINQTFYPFLWSDFSILGETDNLQTYSNSWAIHLWDTELSKTDLCPTSPLYFLENKNAFTRLFGFLINDLFDVELDTITATYGDDEIQSDVTDILLKKFRISNKLIIPQKYVFNDYFVDLLHGKKKKLCINIGSVTHTIEEYRSTNLEFTIGSYPYQSAISATYGSSEKSIDVTDDLLFHFRNDNQLFIPKKCLFNNYFTDPHPDHAKQLLINFDMAYTIEENPAEDFELNLDIVDFQIYYGVPDQYIDITSYAKFNFTIDDQLMFLPPDHYVKTILFPGITLEHSHFLLKENEQIKDQYENKTLTCIDLKTGLNIAQSILNQKSLSDKLYSITFCIPEEKISLEFPTKTKTVSNIYKPKDEYCSSIFAATTLDKGWDCLRHYEIIANYCIPYFPNIEKCPKNTLALFPKNLVIKGNNLYKTLYNQPNLSEDQFAECKQLATDLVSYLKEHLTTKKMAEYILNKTDNQSVSKILFLSEDASEDDLCHLILHGFKKLFGANCHDASDENDILNKKYDIIIYGSYHRGMPFYNLIKKTYAPDKIILLCGEDIHHCYYNYWLNKGHYVFVREL